MPSSYPHEVRKIAQGAGAASGFAGFFFPSLRARGLGEEKPVPPYSAIVYKEGDEVGAEDWKGRKITLGQAGVDDASVIQSAVSAISEGKIYIRKGAYKITQKISCPAGIFFESEGAELNLSSLNDAAFEFGSDDGVADLKLTGMRNFKVTASSSNSNTLLVKASQIRRGFLLEKIMHKDLNNLAEIRGACYDATIRDCWGYDLKGVWIKLVTLDIDGVAYKPNAAEIINCELSNSWSNPGGRGIEVLSSNEDTSTGAVGTIKIHNCWIEAVNVGIYSEGKNTIISNNNIAAVDKGIHINVKQIDGIYMKNSGEAAEIIGNYINVGADAYGIYLDGAPRGHIIVGNWFEYLLGTAIYCANNHRLRIIGNYISFGSDAAVGLSGTTCHSQIEENIFIGNVPSPRGTGINADGYYITIEGNEFVGLKYSINAPSLNGVREEGNIFYGNTNDPLLGTKYRNSGSKTFSGDGSTTDFEIGAHGLATTDPSKIVVKVSPVSQDAIDASPCIGYVSQSDNTKIRIKFGSPPVSGSDNIKITWEAVVIG